MSDPDLVPLLVQENYLNYKPRSAGKDDDGLKRMSLIAHAADSIANSDLINVQIRRYQQWQLSPAGCLSSCIIPASLLHGQRQTLEQGERNFNRFGGWLGKNSTMGKNYRILEDLHVHLLASRESYLGRANLRLDYFTLLTKKLTDPLKVLPKDEAVENVVDFMDSYSISQEDFDNIVEISKFKGHPNLLDGVQPAVKAALTRAYNKGSKSRVIRTADLITLPGIKKAPKKRVAAMLEPLDEGVAEENGEALAEDEENSSETEDIDNSFNVEKKLQLDLQSLNSKGIQVNMDLEGAGSSGGKKPSAGRGRGSSNSKDKGNAESSGKRGGRGSGAAAKRKSFTKSSKTLFIVGLSPGCSFRQRQYSGLANEVQNGRGKVPVTDYKVVEYVNIDDIALPSTSGPINRSCYSFCMCPGGQVVLTSTDPTELCINGMSFSRRTSKWANAALVVKVSSKDFAALNLHGPLAGVEFQTRTSSPVQISRSAAT
ncbi:hypothetical protein K7X08_022659 [Anisodus acutangulus]|uniref:DNA replication factor RFC1 C-terminal domain-containing protein n=1 Tax=Anisodus acutangulus TaxID=402998 RepID=A0A9Q1MLZ7_9SOLA|nr:hypothetical protein K7X08_022659 [Anisodus acutangulus]